MIVFLMVANLVLAVLAALAAILAQVPDPRPTYELWVAVAAIITTVLSSLLLMIPAHVPRLAKQGIVGVVAGVLSAIGLFYAGQLDTGDWGRTWLLVFLGATGVYVILWKPLADAVKGGEPAV